MNAIPRAAVATLGAFAIATALPFTAAAQEAAPPCAACVVLAIAPGEPQTAPGVPTAVVILASSADETVAAALSLVVQVRAVAMILDAREVGALTDEARYRLRTAATTIRATRDTAVGVELLSSQILDPSLDTLAGYVDFVVLPADRDAAGVSTRFPGVAVWTDAPPTEPSALDVITSARLPDSDHLLVRLPSNRTDVMSAIATIGMLRDVLPTGLTPLPEVRVSWCRAAAGVLLLMLMTTCGNGNRTSAPTGPTSTIPQVRIVYRGATARRTDLPASALACANAVGVTHTHPSWRNFAAFPLTPVPPDRYEIAFDDVPVGMRVSFRVNDQNSCDENPTGAVTRNVYANDVALVQNTLTPGSGDEPGYAFTVNASGRVSQ